MSIVTITREVEATPCIHCGYEVLLTVDFHCEIQRRHRTFYCTSCGKNMYYPGESDIEKLQRELSAARQREETIRAMERDARQQAEHHRRRASTYQGHLTRTKRRVAHGVCPCCKRTFEDLARHMQTKHPAYVTDEPA